MNMFKFEFTYKKYRFTYINIYVCDASKVNESNCTRKQNLKFPFTLSLNIYIKLSLRFSSIKVVIIQLNELICIYLLLKRH